LLKAGGDMTQTQEFSGKDIDVAIKNACSKLDL
jgi:hypothetical protein